MPKFLIPASFAVLAAASAAFAQDFSAARSASVTLQDYKFVPSVIQLSAGKPVVLNLSNAADQAHEFAAPEFFRSAAIDPAGAKLVNKEGEVELEGGTKAAIRLVPKAGTYHLQCNKPGHRAMGMQGTIIVK
jgi:uncharacterized cupredoxin-like copper-binding protein